LEIIQKMKKTKDVKMKNKKRLIDDTSDTENTQKKKKKLIDEEEYKGALINGDTNVGVEEGLVGTIEFMSDRSSFVVEEILEKRKNLATKIKVKMSGGHYNELRFVKSRKKVCMSKWVFKDYKGGNPGMRVRFGIARNYGDPGF
jgi:hypothetical protein